MTGKQSRTTATVTYDRLPGEGFVTSPTAAGPSIVPATRAAC